jgi:hypothetical protein
MSDGLYTTDTLVSVRLMTDGGSEDAPPNPPRDSEEGQTQAPERGEDDLIDTGSTDEENDEEDEEEDKNNDDEEEENSEEENEDSENTDDDTSQ